MTELSKLFAQINLESATFQRLLDAAVAADAPIDDDLVPDPNEIIEVDESDDFDLLASLAEDIPSEERTASDDQVYSGSEAPVETTGDHASDPDQCDIDTDPLAGAAPQSALPEAGSTWPIAEVDLSYAAADSSFAADPGAQFRETLPEFQDSSPAAGTIHTPDAAADPSYYSATLMPSSDIFDDGSIHTDTAFFDGEIAPSFEREPFAWDHDSGGEGLPPMS
ncbi:hypothetical protein ACFPVT_00065 [Corynebacterium choanae]|nr:hypothetical protein [Corynebacterium choanae]